MFVTAVWLSSFLAFHLRALGLAQFSGFFPAFHFCDLGFARHLCDLSLAQWFLIIIIIFIFIYFGTKIKFTEKIQ